MARHIITGIDIGTHQVKVVIAEGIRKNGGYAPRIIGKGLAESKGLRHGYIINPGDTIRSVRQAINEAEKVARVGVRRAFVSIGGIGLGSIISQGSTIISRADSLVTELDISKTLETSETQIPQSLSLNKEIIYTIPVQYKIDGKPILGRPVGMKGSKFEVRALFVNCLKPHLDDLIAAIEETGVEVIDVMAAPIAASVVTLNKTQKIAGCVLANIGAETLSIVVFENSIPISLEVFPIGSTDITNDIALGLRISIEEAEQIKLGAITSTNYSKKELDDIVSARLSDMFDLIEAHLKKIGRNGLLPAGIIITGGGSGIGTIEDFAKAALKLPSRKAVFQAKAGFAENLDTTWSVAYGLCVLGLSAENEDGFGKKLVRTTGKNIASWVKRFLP
ncbi:MAG: cell division protein FtsA [Candidatus Pacebacteria bacterium]|nr:cell division protein FtsA [Candidatus Paceibacterota bacterium]